ncbi:MAG TPA: glycosyltransferase family 2 protein [Elusimicrobiota bacterium]|nr:glycosyltransferase family 2 protein [Elusimicrobiota bacterium]
MAGAADRPVLSVVIPFFNEERAIERVVEQWTATLNGLGVAYEFRAYDDCSRDGSWAVLSGLTGRFPRLVLSRNAANLGHGPTIHRGYRESRGDWVFQTDGDNEIAPDHFRALWDGREGKDIVIGRRRFEKRPWPRRLISWVSRSLIKIWTGRTLDVNVPYRLVKKQKLDEALACIPERTFAPNVAMSALACKRGWAISEIDVVSRERSTGQVSIRKWGLWKAALKSFLQTAVILVRS